MTQIKFKNKLFMVVIFIFQMNLLLLSNNKQPYKFGKLLSKKSYKHKSHIGLSVISNDLKLVITGSEDRYVSIWERESGRKLASKRMHKDMVSNVSFSPNNEKFASCDGGITFKNSGYINIWKTKSLKLIHRIKADNKQINCIAFSPDAKKIASYGPESGLKLWDVKTAELLGKSKDYHNQVIRGKLFFVSAFDVLFTNDGKSVVSCGGDGSIIIWNATDLSVRKILKNPHQVNCLDISLDGKYIAGGDSKGNIHIVRVKDWKLIKTYSSLDYGILSLKFYDSDKLLISAGHSKIVKIQESLSGKLVGTLAIDVPSVTSIANSKDNLKLVVVSSGSKKKGHYGDIYYWRVQLENKVKP
ncbi:MAG: hypothetical protein COA79_06780 [Planctomycetota bacterium]|nr:MAG: hypothetical protein COA79_06780 [Planctomycetota bacterium]